MICTTQFEFENEKRKRNEKYFQRKHREIVFPRIFNLPINKYALKQLEFGSEVVFFKLAKLPPSAEFPLPFGSGRYRCSDRQTD